MRGPIILAPYQVALIFGTSNICRELAMAAAMVGASAALRAYTRHALVYLQAYPKAPTSSIVCTCALKWLPDIDFRL